MWIESEYLFFRIPPWFWRLFSLRPVPYHVIFKVILLFDGKSEDYCFQAVCWSIDWNYFEIHSYFILSLFLTICLPTLLTLAQVFFCEFCDIFKKAYREEHLRTADSVYGLQSYIFFKKFQKFTSNYLIGTKNSSLR